MKNNKITIITVCFNAEKEIECTLKSILEQTYTNYEYIVKDGYSSDCTNDIVNCYIEKMQMKGIRCIHKINHDKGIYDAMNQALEYSMGNWVIFMNAGDTFYDEDVLNDVFENKTYDEYKVIYGNTMCILHRGLKFVICNNHSQLVKGIGISQQVCFLEAQTIKERNFDLSCRVLSDYDYLLYLMKHNYKFKKVNSIIAKYNRNGISSREVKRCYEELILLENKYNGFVKIKHISRVKVLIKDIFTKSFPLLSDILYCYKFCR